MAFSQLSIYQGALRALNEARLHTTDGLSEKREARYILDDVWNDGFLDYCLEQGLWLFATRTVRVDYDPSSTPDFGFAYVFQKPDDYIRTSALSQDEYFRCPVQFADEAGVWFCDLQTIYVKYISNDSSYGTDFTKWPDTFNKYAQYELANQSCKAITGKEPEEEFKKEYSRIKLSALSKDAMNDTTKFPPPGKWAIAYRGGRSANIRISNLPGDV